MWKLELNDRLHFLTDLRLRFNDMLGKINRCVAYREYNDDDGKREWWQTRRSDEDDYEDFDDRMQISNYRDDMWEFLRCLEDCFEELMTLFWWVLWWDVTKAYWCKLIKILDNLIQNL